MKGRIPALRHGPLVALAASVIALSSLFAVASPALAIVSPPAGLPLAGLNCQANSTNMPAPSTTTADLPSGTTSPTTLTVTGTSEALTAGQVVTVQPANGFGPQQQFTVTDASDPAGSTSIGVSFTPSSTSVDYPPGARVVLPGANSGSVVPSGPGKISGRGATLPLYAVLNYITQFSEDVCGPVAADTETNTYTPPPGFGEPSGDPTDPSSGADGSGGASTVGTAPNPTYSADQMVAYNYPSAQDTGGTASGQGRNAISCRTDAFAGSDIPYSTTDLANMDGAPGAEANGGTTTTGGLGSCQTFGVISSEMYSPTSPFQSTGASTDPAGKVMSFPIAGSAIALAVNLPAACQNPGGGYKFSSLDIAEIWSGNLYNWAGIDPWNDPNLTAANGCDIAITRVVGRDTEGTTQNFDNYLAGIDGDAQILPGGENLCGPLTDGFSTPFTGLPGINGTLADMAHEVVDSTAANGFINPVTQAKNDFWPDGDLCSYIRWAPPGGTPSVLQSVDHTPGAIGYADVADEVRDPGDAAALVTPSLETSDNSTYAMPTTNTGASNCSYASASLPGSGTADDDMGIHGEWAVNASPDHTDVTFSAQGSGYPICALTWAFVFEGDDGNAKTTAGTNQGLLYPDDSLTSALTSGTSYLSLSVTALPVELFAGQVITLGTGANTQAWTVSANAAKGATTIGVTAQLANNNYPVGSGVATKVLNVSSVPAGTPSQGTMIVTAGGTRQTATYNGIVGNQFQNVAGAVGPLTAASTVELPSGTGGPEPELDPNQRMTLYSFMSYVLSTTAQSTDDAVGYAPLPAGFIDALRIAFQTDY